MSLVRVGGSSLESLVIGAVMLVGAGSANAAGATASAPSAASVCEAAESFGDVRLITCRIDASATARRFRFRVTFSGGHDDTSASIRATLDGAPLACDAGSKTRLFGEDGEVSLLCRFTVAAGPPASHEYAVEVLWSHAQYKDFELALD